MLATAWAGVEDVEDRLERLSAESPEPWPKELGGRVEADTGGR